MHACLQATQRHAARSSPAAAACSAASVPCVSASCSLRASTGSSAVFATAAAMAASLAAACAAARPLCSSSSCCWQCCWCCRRLLPSALPAERLVTRLRSCRTTAGCAGQPVQLAFTQEAHTLHWRRLAQASRAAAGTQPWCSVIGEGNLLTSCCCVISCAILACVLSATVVASCSNTSATCRAGSASTAGQHSQHTTSGSLWPIDRLLAQWLQPLPGTPSAVAQMLAHLPGRCIV